MMVIEQCNIASATLQCGTYNDFTHIKCCESTDLFWQLHVQSPNWAKWWFLYLRVRLMSLSCLESLSHSLYLQLNSQSCFWAADIFFNEFNQRVWIKLQTYDCLRVISLNFLSSSQTVVCSLFPWMSIASLLNITKVKLTCVASRRVSHRVCNSFWLIPFPSCHSRAIIWGHAVPPASLPGARCLPHNWLAMSLQSALHLRKGLFFNLFPPLYPKYISICGKPWQMNYGRSLLLYCSLRGTGS